MKNEKHKLRRAIKAMFPIAALFGGNAVASSRNPLSSQSTRNLRSKAVIVVDSSNNRNFNKLNHKAKIAVKSPFSAFSSNQSPGIKRAKVAVNSQAIDFLKHNQLFNSSHYQNSTLSGNITSKGRKAFSHTFSFVNSYSNDTETCANTQYDSFQYFISYSARTYNATLSTYTSATSCALLDNMGGVVSTVFDEANCQLQHQQCAGHINLPIDLLKFEVD